VTSAFFIGSIFTPWALPVSVILLAITLIGWFWPKRPETDLPGDQPVSRPVEAEG
jgi:cytochrome c oxidase subunit 1